jgi:hypothetical protein
MQILIETGEPRIESLADAQYGRKIYNKHRMIYTKGTVSQKKMARYGGATLNHSSDFCKFKFCLIKTVLIWKDLAPCRIPNWNSARRKGNN